MRFYIVKINLLNVIAVLRIHDTALLLFYQYTALYLNNFYIEAEDFQHNYYNFQHRYKLPNTITGLACVESNEKNRENGARTKINSQTYSSLFKINVLKWK